MKVFVHNKWGFKKRPDGNADSSLCRIFAGIRVLQA